MSVINYAIEIETDSTLSDATLAITNGMIRIITGRPVYSGTEAGGSSLPYGDHSILNIALGGAETLSVSMQSGELFAASNGTWKTADTVIGEGERFTIDAAVDTSDARLAAAKGAAIAIGDCFLVTSNVASYEVIEYVGTNRWYTGFIVKDGLSRASRRADIDPLGEYGTFSGFNFVLTNAAKYWNLLASNEIYLVNQRVKLYVVIDDEFYLFWSGEVANNPYNETDYRVICKDGFTAIHKAIPPVVINATNFADAPDESHDQVIPVCVGDVPYARLVNVEGTPSPVTLVTSTLGSFSACAILGYTEYVDARSAIVLYTPGTSFDIGDLTGNYFLRVLFGPGGDTEKLYRISSNGATAADQIGLVLEGIVDGLTAAGADALYDKVTPAPDTDTWWVEVVYLPISHVVSENPINGYKADTYSRAQLWSYDDDRRQYTNIQNSILSTNTGIGGSPAHPHIGILSDVLLRDGSISDYYGFAPSQVDLDNGVSLGANVIDRDRSTSSYMGGLACSTGVPNELFIIDCYVPDAVVDDKTDDVFITLDVHYEATLDSGPGEVTADYGYNVKLLDVYGNELSTYATNGHTFTETTASNELEINVVPNRHYENGGDDNSEDTSWGYMSIEANFKLDATSLAMIRNGHALPVVRVKVYANPTADATIYYYAKEVVFVTTRQANVLTGKVYTRVEGELTSAVETDNVYRAFQLLLETYDGIDDYRIDYGNLATERAAWYVGRQLTERRNSFEYLKELCRQSFVALFPSRKGYRKLKAWREDLVSAATHDESTVLRGSIKNWRKTEITNVFNDFYIRYSWNPGADKFDRAFFITHVDEDSFPAYSASEDAAWRSYVGGLSGTGYAEAKNLWLICHESFTQAKVVRQFPDDDSACHWYTDRTIFDSTETTGISADSSAFLFLTNLCEWCSRQKDLVDYALPINATNVVLDLLDRITFNDAIYTNSADRGGWLTMVGIDPAKDIIFVESLLEPDDISTSGGVYTETGSAADTISETDAATDTITES